MNTPRLVVLGLAAIAAGGAAFLARGLLGGGTSHSAASQMPPPIATSDVLVAASDLIPGQKVLPEQVRWQKWPTSSIDPSFITSTNAPNVEATVKGTVVRSPIVAGEPLTQTKIVHADSASFMSATLTPGMRAVSITVSVASIAGGFILPNDHVDLVLSTQISDSPRRFKATTLLRDVRVLAIDQAFDTKSQKAVSDVRTATLELSPEQAEKVVRGQATGTLSLALRSLIETASTGNDRVAAARAKFNNAGNGNNGSDASEVSVIRYGLAHADAGGKGD